VLPAFLRNLRKIRRRGLLGSAIAIRDLAKLYLEHRFLSGATGVIHVGANDGFERHLYALYGLNVLWIEPLPDVFQKLQKNLLEFPKQKARNALITDRDGAEYVFHVANNSGLSSSIFEIGDHRHVWPDIHYIDHIKMRSTTLDSLLSGDIGSAIYNVLVLDTQGSELLVLKGAADTLRHIKFIRTETADFQTYVGASKIDDISNYLHGHDFRFVRADKFADKPGIGRCFDALYEKRSSS
jgi:FkbM family methyltransferase